MDKIMMYVTFAQHLARNKHERLLAIFITNGNLAWFHRWTSADL